jgi:transposase
MPICTTCKKEPASRYIADRKRSQLSRPSTSDAQKSADCHSQRLPTVAQAVGNRKPGCGDEQSESAFRLWHRLRQDHRAGEKMFVDWAGPTIPIYDRISGEVQPASLFVAALGASSYTFARATLGQDLPNWIECHLQAFEFFQGTTKLIVPDNPRTGVTRACRYEPDLNRTYLDMAQFYRVAIMPARPYKPRDKTWVS